MSDFPLRENHAMHLGKGNFDSVLYQKKKFEPKSLITKQIQLSLNYFENDLVIINMSHLLWICLFACFDDPEPRDEWHTRKIWLFWEELSFPWWLHVKSAGSPWIPRKSWSGLF